MKAKFRRPDSKSTVNMGSLLVCVLITTALFYGVAAFYFLRSREATVESKPIPDEYISILDNPATSTRSSKIEAPELGKYFLELLFRSISIFRFYYFIF